MNLNIGGTLTAGEVTEFIVPRAAHYKRIRRVEFVESTPKSPSGKILRRVLVERERASQIRAGVKPLTRCRDGATLDR